MEHEKVLTTITDWILHARHAVAFTGAGISTDSGIPDFRGPDGVWTRRDAGLPPPRWRTKPDAVRPNASHVALVELERLGKLRYLISQNVDGLHVASGFPLDRIAELHGNGKLMRCTKCDERFRREDVGWNDPRWGNGYRTDRVIPGQPPCPKCRGRLISSVVNFGDPLPRRELAEAAAHAEACDLMLVLGSSLVVNPAAALVGVAIEAGARVVLINRGETPYDDLVTLRSERGIGEILPVVTERVRARLAA